MSRRNLFLRKENFLLVYLKGSDEDEKQTQHILLTVLTPILIALGVLHC